MSGIVYQVMYRPRVGVARQEGRFTDHDKALAVCRQLTSGAKEGYYFIQELYPIAEMKTEKFDSFVALVAQVREHQRLFYAGRDRQVMMQSIELEGRLRQYIDKCKAIFAAHPEHKPQPAAKLFFDMVDIWLGKAKEYFAHKKANDEDPLVIRERLKECKDYERRIDQVVEQYTKYQPSDK